MNEIIFLNRFSEVLTTMDYFKENVDLTKSVTDICAKSLFTLTGDEADLLEQYSADCFALLPHNNVMFQTFQEEENDDLRIASFAAQQKNNETAAQYLLAVRSFATVLFERLEAENGPNAPLHPKFDEILARVVMPFGAPTP